MRMTRRKSIALLAIAAGLVIALWFVFHRTHRFDSRRIAAAETNMWRAYYSRDYWTMGKEMVALLRSQFALSYYDSGMVARDLGHAAQTFQPTPRGTQQVLIDLEKAYERIRRATGSHWDSAEAARAELAWWAARRTPGVETEQVGKLIEHLYEVLYGRTNAEIAKAGLLRAQAAALRDSGGANANWPEVQKLLEESYSTLLRGISEPDGGRRK